MMRQLLHLPRDMEEGTTHASVTANTHPRLTEAGVLAQAALLVAGRRVIFEISKWRNS